MLVTDHFVFIHVHRTGGQFLRVFFNRFFPEIEAIGYHFPLSLLPEQFRDLPVLSVVRNPLDWYVSFYEKNLQRMRRSGRKGHALFEEVSKGGTLGFVEATERLVRLSEATDEAVARRAVIAKGFPMELVDNGGINLTHDDVISIGATCVGYFTWLFHRMTGGGQDRLRILRFEEFTQILPRALSECGVEVTDGMVDFLKGEQPRNASERRPFPEYYTPALKDLVFERDGGLIKKYGYEA